MSPVALGWTCCFAGRYGGAADDHPSRTFPKEIPVAVLTIGDKFPEYDLTSVVDIDQARPEDAFEQINHKTYEGKWRIVFFC